MDISDIITGCLTQFWSNSLYNVLVKNRPVLFVCALHKCEMGFFTSSLLLPTRGKKSVRETGLVTTQPSYLFTVWESGVSVCGILFLVSTHGQANGRHSPRTTKKIYIRLSKIKDRKKQYDFPERISECRLRRGMGCGVWVRTISI